MADQQPDVRTGSRRFERGALRRQIHRAAAVGIRDDGGDPLRDERLALMQRGGPEPVAGMRVDVDEPGRDDAIAGVDDAGRGRGRKLPDGRDAVAGDADVGAQPGVARAIHDAGVANQDVEVATCGCAGSAMTPGRSRQQ